MLESLLKFVVVIDTFCDIRFKKLRDPRNALRCRLQSNLTKVYDENTPDGLQKKFNQDDHIMNLML